VKVIHLVAVIGLLTGVGCGEAQSPTEAVSGPVEVDATSQAEACTEPEGVAPERVLARMCGRVITVEDLEKRLESLPRRARERYRAPGHLRQLLDEMVHFEILLAEAERRGLDRDPEVREAREQAMVRVLLRQEIQNAAGMRTSDIRDDEVEEYYRTHQDEFSDTERVRASHIRVSDRKLGERLLSQILAAPEDQELFGRLAKEHSEDGATRERGGDLGYFARPGEGRKGEPEVPSEVAEAAFSLEEIGAVSPQLVGSADGWHIVRLTGRREAWHRTLEEARGRIQSLLLQKRRRERLEAFVEEARQRLEVEVNEDALGLVQAPRTEGTP
jgi:parvulin-like peptidyl-prolyl isomerase